MVDTCEWWGIGLSPERYGVLAICVCNEQENKILATSIVKPGTDMGPKLIVMDTSGLLNKSGRHQDYISIKI